MRSEREKKGCTEEKSCVYCVKKIKKNFISRICTKKKTITRIQANRDKIPLVF